MIPYQMHQNSVFGLNKELSVKLFVLLVGCYISVSHLSDVLQRLSVHHAVEFGG